MTESYVTRRSEGRTNGPCALCEHDPSCGFAMVNDLYLCHADDHSCYVRWTVWSERPETLGESGVGVP